MNTKGNQRARLTKMLMKQAYMELLHEKKTERISVKEICEHAEVNRSTFYLHYNEPNDLLTEIEDEAIALIREALSAIGGIDKPSQTVTDYLLLIIRHIKNHEALFRTLLVENSDPHFRRKLRAVALEMMESSFRVELDRDRKQIVYLYVVSGSLEVLTDWIANHCLLREETICETLFALCEGAIRTVL